MSKKPKKNNLAVDVAEQELVLINESPDTERGSRKSPPRLEPSWEPRAMGNPEPERKDTSDRVLTHAPLKTRSFRHNRATAPAEKRGRSRSFLVLLVVSFLGGLWLTAFHTYLGPLSKPATARPQQANGKGFPVYQIPGAGPRCLVELESMPSGTQVRVNRVWSAGLTPTTVSLSCQKTALLTLTTKDGLVSHETLKPTRPLESRKLKVSMSPVFRATTWLLLVSDFHAQFFQKR